jgi:hypothetical protein
MSSFAGEAAHSIITISDVLRASIGENLNLTEIGEPSSIEVISHLPLVI